MDLPADLPLEPSPHMLESATHRQAAPQLLHQQIAEHRQMPIALGSGRSDLTHKLRGGRGVCLLYTSPSPRD
eukprot:10668796-Alexandrium_andersonii.AAC.1